MAGVGSINVRNCRKEHTFNFYLENGLSNKRGDPGGSGDFPCNDFQAVPGTEAEHDMSPDFNEPYIKLDVKVIKSEAAVSDLHDGINLTCLESCIFNTDRRRV